jgi:cell fate regulator YaaT (PSP1 superfamily)
MAEEECMNEQMEKETVLDGAEVLAPEAEVEGTEEVLPPVKNETPTEAAPAEEKMVEIVGVGFRTAGKTYYFAPKQFQLKAGENVIVETSRGVEFGRITLSNREVSEREITQPLREIIRPATKEDVARYEDNKRLEERAAEICREKIKQHKLEMDLVSVEYTFDNTKLLFYFTAESRVDFRALVKDLASFFKTRIELRQIGIRDEAKLMGGFGSCGRPFCCTTFLSDFVQVSIKMAKEQNFSLNSAKISGACGRLMCCLRYEHEVYEEAVAATPTNGSYVNTPNGLGTVVETRPLAATVKVKLEDKAEAPRLYPVSEIKVLRSKGKGGLQPDADAEEIMANAARLAEEKANAPKPEERQRPPRGGQPRTAPQGEEKQKQNPNKKKKRPHHHKRGGGGGNQNKGQGDEG